MSNFEIFLLILLAITLTGVGSLIYYMVAIIRLFKFYLYKKFNLDGPLDMYEQIAKECQDFKNKDLNK